MIYLVLVSFVWAFSFGLIKGNLADLDPNFVAFARMLLSTVVFLPFLRLRGVRAALATKLTLVGAVQFGVMYVAYIHSYRYLEAHEVALYTIFTPIYVTLLRDALGRRFRPSLVAAAALSVAAAWIAIGGRDARGIEIREGFWILQVSNLAFAAGQVGYRSLLRREPQLRDREVFGLLYLGALAVTGAAAAVTVPGSELVLGGREIATLLYLGILASGICFFLWNFGARRSRAGTLAVLNNLKIPLGVACSLLFFGESADVPSLLVGGGILAVAIVASEGIERRGKGSPPSAPRAAVRGS
jgi:drug/metabolite transporter (DMT)-like permease